MKTKSLRGEKGQAAVLITILLMFALIALTALAIDGGHLYVVRRDLQNMSDAACLAAATELALGGDEAGAITQAKEYVIRNGGDFFSAWPAEEPNVGTGTGLTWGIEVTGANVRVALQEDVDTYFTMIFNRSSALVGTRSRCNSQSGGGLLPIAVRRYEYDEDTSQQLDLLANKQCLPDACYYDIDSDTVLLPGRYTEGLPLFPFRPVLDPYVPMTGTLTATTTGNIDCDLSSPKDGNYEGVCVLGVETETNDGTENYTGWVTLDIRNIVGPGPIEYLNGATGQAATNKALASEWFCGRSWTGWDPPVLGDQLAFLPGVSADFAPKAMLECNPPWKAGERFVAVVYSGYVWDVPDLEMSIEPVVGWISPTITDTIEIVTYTVTLEKIGPAPWPDANFILDGFFMEEEVEAYGEITPTVGFNQNPVILLQGQDSVTATMTVSATNPISLTNYTNYLSALTVQAHETLLGLERWASTSLAYRGDPPFDPDFTLYAHALEFNAPQGGKVPVILPTMAFGDFKEKNVDVDAVLWGANPWNSVFTPASQHGTIDIPNSKDTFDLRVQAGAPVGQYTVTLTATPKDGDVPSHSVDIVVNVYVPTGGTPTRFVIVQGFAPFEMSYIDVNTVAAFAIGPILPDLGSAQLYGMRASLLPW